ncbi:MAG: TetR/AcrR family transcriptional regulator [Candidatus Omnitrophota bacterium]|jgi:AcrR family transcriptional regulator
MAGLNRKERDLLLRKTDILKAAERIFALKGYDKARIQDIAKEAQYAAGTVYLYFKDKRALYFSLFEGKMKDFLSLIKKEIVSANDASEKLEIFLKKELEFFKENRAFFQIFISENKASRLAIDYKISNSRVSIEYSNLTRSLIKMAQQQGIVRSDLDPNQIAGILHSISTSIIIGWFLKSRHLEPQDPKETARFILNIFLDGIGQKTEKGKSFFRI